MPRLTDPSGRPPKALRECKSRSGLRERSVVPTAPSLLCILHLFSPVTQHVPHRMWVVGGLWGALELSPLAPLPLPTITPSPSTPSPSTPSNPTPIPSSRLALTWRAPPSPSPWSPPSPLPSLSPSPSSLSASSSSSTPPSLHPPPLWGPPCCELAAAGAYLRARPLL